MYRFILLFLFLVTDGVIQFHDDTLGEVQLGADGVFVHHGTCHCTQTKGVAGKVDVLRHIASIHGGKLIVSTTVALVAYQQQGKGASSTKF